MVGLLGEMNPLLSYGLGLLSVAGPSTQQRSLGEGLLAGHQMNMQGQLNTARVKQAATQQKLADLEIAKAERAQKGMDDFQSRLIRSVALNGQPTPVAAPTMAGGEAAATGGTGVANNSMQPGQASPLGLPYIDANQARMLAMMPPEQAMSIYQGIVSQQFKPKDPIKVGAGEVVLDPVTRQPIYTAREKAPEGMQWVGDQLVPIPGYSQAKAGFVGAQEQAKAPFNFTAVPAGGMLVNHAALAGGRGGAPATAGAPAGGQQGGIQQPMPGVYVDQRPQIGTKIEEKAFDAYEAISRLNNVSQSFKPEYLQFGTRLGAEWSALKERLGAGLNDAQKSELQGFSTFKRDALNNLNKTLNELSGAAVSPAEGQRIAAELPNPGTGVFDGDSPTEFKSKLERASSSLRNATMRYAYAKNNGIDPMKIPLDQVPQLMNKRGEEISKALRQQYPNVDDATLKGEVTVRLRREFGLMR